ncbi:hypothetical protein SMITH_31 [Smithella sp. ME-1]|nr:hypothetical protein SMITH_31 [Smithella sp. ME-1]
MAPFFCFSSISAVKSSGEREVNFLFSLGKDEIEQKLHE